MKKIRILISNFVILLSICIGVSSVDATSINLEKVVEKFNNSSIVEDYKNAGEDINATKDEDSLNITVNVNNETKNVEFLYQENVLSIEIDEDDDDAFLKAYITLNLVDIIGQLHGYPEAELLKTINSSEADNYTLEKEGYEKEKISETKSKIKVDITKKIPLADFSNTYIEVSDIQYLRDFISGDGSAEDSKGNVWFNKSGYNGKYTLLVAEKDNLTENAYKSILSILEVMVDNDNITQYFKKNYSSILSGDKDFDGFKIKINPEDKTEFEEFAIPSDKGYKFVRIVIDKSLVISKVTEEVGITNVEVMWDKFIEKYKTTEIMKEYNDNNISVDIKSTESTLNSIVDDGTIKLVGNFNYKDGVVSYVPLDDKKETFETIFNEETLVENAIVALANLKGYDVKKLKTWLYENEGKLNLEKDGIEYTLEDYTKTQDNGVTLTVKKVKSFKFKLDSEIKLDTNKVVNPKTGLDLNYNVLLGIILISGIIYTFVRKQSKFPKHN